MYSNTLSNSLLFIHRSHYSTMAEAIVHAAPDAPQEAVEILTSSAPVSLNTFHSALSGSKACLDSESLIATVNSLCEEVRRAHESYTKAHNKALLDLTTCGVIMTVKGLLIEAILAGAIDPATTGFAVNTIKGICEKLHGVNGALTFERSVQLANQLIEILKWFDHVEAKMKRDANKLKLKAAIEAKKEENERKRPVAKP
jgi:hypothetical protein